MISLDMIVAYYLPGNFAWVFLVFVLIAESVMLTYYLRRTYFNRHIYLSVVISNILTTVVGFLVLDTKNNGGQLLNWIPVEKYHAEFRIDLTLFVFISSFIVTLLIETMINQVLLRKIESKKKIFVGTLIINVFTYLVAGIIIWTYAVKNF